MKRRQYLVSTSSAVVALTMLLIISVGNLALPRRAVHAQGSGHLVIVDGIQISPTNPRLVASIQFGGIKFGAIQLGGSSSAPPPSPGSAVTVTATFRLRNETGRTVTIRRLRAGARGPGACALGWNSPNVDFPAVENLTLRPGQEYVYRQSRSFSQPGDYFAEPVMQDAQGRWGGIRPFPRVWFNVADAAGNVPLPECLVLKDSMSLSRTSTLVGQEVEASFVLHNNGRESVTIRQLIAAARGPAGPEKGWDAPQADFPAVTNIVLAPGQKFLYRQRRAFTLPGDYFVEPAFLNADGRWGGIWPWSRTALSVSCPTLAPGVQRCHGNDYELIIADLTSPKVQVRVATAHNWTDPEVFQAQTVQKMVADPAVSHGCSVVVGVNGGYFGPGEHNSEGWTVANGRTRREMKAKVQTNQEYIPQHWPSFIITPDGHARIGRYLWQSSPAQEAVTAGPIFIEAGQVLSVDSDSPATACKEQRLPEHYCRDRFSQSVVAVSKDGRRLYLLVTQPWTLKQAADLLGPSGLNVWTAMKLDGRSSAQMVYRADGSLQSFIPIHGGGKVTDAILVCTR